MTAPRKILHCTFSLGMGGLENLVLELLSRLDKTSFSPVICTLQNAGKLQECFERNGIPVHVLEKRAGLDFSLPVRLARLIKTEGIDLVHSHNYAPWLYAGIAAGMLQRRPLVHTEHSHVPLSQRSALWGERLVARMTDHIIADCEYVHRFITQHVLADMSRVSVVYNGIDVARYHAGGDAAVKRRELLLDTAAPVAGIVARLVPVKQHAVLLDAFQKVLQSIPSAILLIVGDGELRADLEAQCGALGISPQVRFLGARFDVPDLLRVMDVLVLASESEGFSLALLEAMAAERPIVATAVGGNAEIVADRLTGYIVPSGDAGKLADALRLLLGNLPQARRMGSAGYQRVTEKFGLSGMVAAYERLYHALLDGKGAGA